MERVVKRFLLHNNRENEDIRESDFDELKQDVQMVRFEMLNHLRQSKEDAVRYTSILHNGLAALGEFVCSSMQNSEVAEGFKDFQKLEKNLQQELNHYEDPNKMFISFVKDHNFSTSKHEETSRTVSIKRKDSSLSLKFEETVHIIPDTDSSLSGGDKKETAEGKINNEAAKSAKHGYLDLNAINEEN